MYMNWKKKAKKELYNINVQEPNGLCNPMYNDVILCISFVIYCLTLSTTKMMNHQPTAMHNLCFALKK